MINSTNNITTDIIMNDNKRLERIWRASNLNFTTKYSLFRPLVLSIFLYGCETWTLLSGAEKKIDGFETKCSRKLLRISYVEHKSN